MIEIPVSKIISIGEKESLIIRRGSPCSGEIVSFNSPDAVDIKRKVKRVSFILEEIDRLRLLLSTDFTLNAPEKVFFSVCNSLLDYENEIDAYDKTFLVNVCQ